MQISLPELPSAYLSCINNNIIYRATNKKCISNKNSDLRDNEQQIATGSQQIVTKSPDLQHSATINEGERDETLFHTATCLISWVV